MNPMPKSSPEKELVKVLDAAQIVDFLEYVQSGKRLIWTNFKAGVARGVWCNGWNDGGAGYNCLGSDDAGRFATCG